MFVFFSVWALLICLGYELAAIWHPYSLDYGEAPLVNQAMLLVSGHNIYRADISQPPFIISNYPPLYVAVIALGVKLFGPASSFFFGRIVSALCAWIASLCIAFILYQGTRDRLAAFCGAATFLAFPFVVFWSPLLRIDMLALALSLCGLCLLIWTPDSRRYFIGAGLLLVAAIYTRQSYALAAPLAAFVWLFSRDWRQALRFAGLVGGLTLIFFFLLNALTQGGFFLNIVTANVNEFKMDQLTYHWNRIREAALILLLFGAASLLLPLGSWIAKFVKRLNKPEPGPEVHGSRDSLAPGWNSLWALAAPYLLGSIFSAVTIGKIGSNVNYLLELCAALGLTAGVVIAWSRLHLHVHFLRAGILILLAVGVGRMMHFMLTDYGDDLRDRRAASTELHKLKSLVAETPGAILADEYMGMLTLLGRPLMIQPFEVSQLARDGKWDQTALLERIHDKEYSAIILYDRPWSLNDRWTPEMLEAVYSTYTLVDVVAENKIYKVAEQRAVSPSVDSCPGAAWRLPSDGSLGIQIQDGRLDFFGQGSERKIPVYAVADGFLIRAPDWIDAVAIQHEDPLHPGTKVWTYYGGMASASGLDSFVADAFPLGSAGVPVKSGDLLGYQGSWSGQPFWGAWIHSHFAVIRAADYGTFPETLGADQMRDAAPYLGIRIEAQNENLQPLRCSQL